MLYGETFINLEQNTARTEAMSETIYVAYRNAIELKGDSAEVDFARKMNLTISVSDLMDLKLPAPMVFELGMTFGTVSVTGETDY